MKYLAILSFCLTALTGPVLAEAAPEKVAACEKSTAVVMAGVQARRDGVPMRKARREMHAALDRTAGDVLAEWIYGLPEDQLTDEIGEAWKAQCLAQ